MNQTQPQLPLNAYEQPGTKGNTEPRLSTPPLRELTPETSYGFAVIEFARDVLKEPLTPWQEWFVVHAGELLKDGRPRFRKALCLVARQNGKTHLLKVLSCFWLFVQGVEQILGLSTNRESAKEAWDKALKLARDSDILYSLIATVKTGNNDTFFTTVYGGVYRIRAANDGAARGLTIDRIIFDELRQQKSFDAWDAVMPTMAARPYAQAICISNAGDDSSVVLNKLQAEALEFIATGTGDYRLGLFEWSAAPGDDITLPDTWAKANPNMGYIFTEDELRGDAISAMNQGGEVLAGFKTERLCMRVSNMDAAIDPDKWALCYDESHSLSDVPKSALKYFFDVSPLQTHATLTAAYTFPDGITRIELVHEWRDTAVQNAIRDLRKLAPKHAIKVLGFFPTMNSGFATSLKTLRIAGFKVQEVTSEVSEACEGFATDVFGRRISHQSNDSTDQVLTQQAIATGKTYTGDRWKFTRRNAGNCDATYAAAGAWLLANTAPQIGPGRLVGPDDEDGEE